MPQSRARTALAVLAVLIALAGAILSGILLQHHVVARIGGDPMLSAACEAAATFSCDEVIASKWGKLEFDLRGRHVIVPTAMLGFAFFVAVASWYLLLGAPDHTHRRLALIPLVATTAGLLGAIGFEYIMFFVLDKRCPLCIATHVAILLLFVFSLALWRSRPQEAAATGATVTPPASPVARLIFAAIVLAGVSTALGWFIYQQQLSEGYSREYFARWQDYDQDTRLNYDRFLAQPPVEIPIHPDDAVWGPADAKHTVVVFSDFLCPACQALEITVLEQRRKEFPGQFRLVFKHFPLDKTCNPEIPRALHPGACGAAVAVEAVHLLEGDDAFWTMHDAVFHNPGRFSTAFAFKEAEKLGLSREEYLKRIQTTSAWNTIKRNVAEGRTLGIESTPVLYVDGRQMKAWGDRHLWKYLLSDETLQAPASQPASQPAGPSASQPAAPSISRPTVRTASQPTDRPASQPTS